MSGVLPQGWVSVELEDHVYIAGRIGWRGLKRSEYTKTGPQFISVKNILPNGTVDFKQTDHISLDRYNESPEIQLQPGDILLTKDGTIGKVGMVDSLPGKTTVNSSILVVRPQNPLLLNRYLFHYLRGPQFQTIARDRITGSAIPHLFQKDIKKLIALIPPLSEQRYIVTKLDMLLNIVYACQKRLEKMPVVIKRFRQAVLAAAYSGRLTADWREKACDVESGIELLGRIKKSRISSAKSKKEKDQLLSAFERQHIQREGDELSNNIPNTWAYCQIGAIGTVCNGSTPSRKVQQYWGGSIPWVSSGEVRNNIISKTQERITKAGYNNSSVRLLPKGTVLLAMIGEGKTRGQTAILNTSATINQNIAAVILADDLVSSRYLWYWFQRQYYATREMGGGSGPQALNCQRVRELPFVLPPVLEQHEVVRRVEALFEMAYQIEARYTKAKMHVDRIAQSILSKAFRGELVPQDLNTEPASVFLEKLLSARKQYPAKRFRTNHQKAQEKATSKRKA